MGILDGPLVYVDIETNGLDAIRGRVIEVAAIRVENSEIQNTFVSLIDPQTPLPQFITGLTGIVADDLRSAPTFLQIAGDLYSIMEGAVFVAHSVRFDYSFLKQEFKRVGLPFLPKQLCTVKLSKALYPRQKSHKLETVIKVHGLTYQNRHRAFDDAHVLWQFVQYAQQAFPTDVIEAAVAKQMRRPALPKSLSADFISELPDTSGVYIFEDQDGKPLYVGKSINIRQRVLQHFGSDHENPKEFKMAQSVKHISTQTTAGELQALLLESQLIKDLQPIYNRQLRRINKLILVRRDDTPDGYASIEMEEASAIDPSQADSILAVYKTRGQAKRSLDNLAKTFDLCPKLLGLEKSKGACFLYQLGKCQGACAGKESPESYNQRLEIAFEHGRIKAWPYHSPVLLQEQPQSEGEVFGIIVDQWCIIGQLKIEPHCDPIVSPTNKVFDLDTYKILQAYITRKLQKLSIKPLNAEQIAAFGL